MDNIIQTLIDLYRLASSIIFSSSYIFLLISNIYIITDEFWESKELNKEHILYFVASKSVLRKKFLPLYLDVVANETQTFKVNNFI